MDSAKVTGRIGPPTRPKPQNVAGSFSLANQQGKGVCPKLPKRPPVEQVNKCSAAVPKSKVAPALPKLSPRGKLPIALPKPGGGVSTGQLCSNPSYQGEGALDKSDDNLALGSTDATSVTVAEEGIAAAHNSTVENQVPSVGGSPDDHPKGIQNRPRPAVTPRPVPAKRKSLDKVKSQEVTAADLPVDAGREEFTFVNSKQAGPSQTTEDIPQVGSQPIDASPTSKDSDQYKQEMKLSMQPVKPPRPIKSVNSNTDLKDKTPDTSPKNPRKESPECSNLSPLSSNELVSDRKMVEQVTSVNHEKDRPRSVATRPAPPPPKPKPRVAEKSTSTVRLKATNLSDSISVGLKQQISAINRPKPPPKPKPQFKKPVDKSEAVVTADDVEKRRESIFRRNNSYEEALEEPVHENDASNAEGKESIVAPSDENTNKLPTKMVQVLPVFKPDAKAKSSEKNTVDEAGSNVKDESAKSFGMDAGGSVMCGRAERVIKRKGVSDTEDGPSQLTPSEPQVLPSENEQLSETKSSVTHHESVVKGEKRVTVTEASGSKSKRVPTRAAPPPPVFIKKPSAGGAATVTSPTSPAPPMLKPLGRPVTHEKKVEQIEKKDKDLPQVPSAKEELVPKNSIYDEQGYLVPVSSSQTAVKSGAVYSYADCPMVFPEDVVQKKTQDKNNGRKAGRSQSAACIDTLKSPTEEEKDVQKKKKKLHRHSSGSSNSRASVTSLGSHLYEMIKSRSSTGTSEEMAGEKEKQEERISQSIFYIGIDDDHQPDTMLHNVTEAVGANGPEKSVESEEGTAKVPSFIEPIEPYGMTDIIKTEPQDDMQKCVLSIDTAIPVAPPRRKKKNKANNLPEAKNCESKDEEVNNNLNDIDHVYETPPNDSETSSESESESDSDDYIYPEAQNPELEAKMFAKSVPSPPPPVPPPRLSVEPASPPPLPAKDTPVSQASTSPVPHSHKSLDMTDSPDASESNTTVLLGSKENEYSEVDEGGLNRVSSMMGNIENEYNEVDNECPHNHEYSDVDDIDRLMGDDHVMNHESKPFDDGDDFYDDTLPEPKNDSDGDSTLKRASTPTDRIKSSDIPSPSSTSSCTESSSLINSPDGISELMGMTEWKSQGSGVSDASSSERPVSWASSDAGSDYISMSKHNHSDLYMNYSAYSRDSEVPSSINQSSSSESEGEVEMKGDQSSTNEETLQKQIKRQETKKLRRKKKAMFIAQEIVSSEKSFVDVLKLLHVHFRTVLYNSSKQAGYPVVPPNVVNQILRYLPQLLRFNEDLLKDLQYRVDHWEDNPKIADVFVQKGPFLKLYTSYIREFESMTTALDEARKKYPDFDSIVKSFEASPRCANLQLKSYMLKPIQRIPQYRLLLGDYLKQLTEDMPDYKDTQTALVIVSEVADHANQSMKYGDNFKKLWEIQHNLIGQFEVIEPGRVFIKEGELMKLSRKEMQPRMFFLLNDVLLYTTPVTNGYRLNNAIPLRGMKVSKPTKEDFQNEFSILSTQRSFTISASTPQERDDWLQVLQETIEDNIQRKFSFDVRKLSLTTNSMSVIPIEMENKEFALGSRAPVWVPDVRVSMCMLCTAQFTVTFRRHHCRSCGKVVCGFCSDYKAPLRYLKYKSARVCRQCFEALVKEVDEMDDEIEVPSGGRTPTDEATSPWSKLSIKSRFKGLRFGSFRKNKYVRPAVLQEVQANDDNAEMSGYLKIWKQGKWKKKWFVLKGKALYTYKASEDAAASESRVLLGYDVRIFNTFSETQSCEQNKNNWFEGVEPSLVFEISHRGTSPMIFRTESLASKEKWVTAMTEATVP